MDQLLLSYKLTPNCYKFSKKITYTLIYLINMVNGTTYINQITIKKALISTQEEITMEITTKDQKKTNP